MSPGGQCRNFLIPCYVIESLQFVWDQTPIDHIDEIYGGQIFRWVAVMWHDFKIGHQDNNSPSNAHQGEMPIHFHPMAFQAQEVLLLCL